MILFIRWKRWIGGFLFLTALVMLLTWLIGRMILVKSLPVLSGEIEAEGLRSPVEVFRDDHGVPHILADNEHDLMFIEGYVHAQDRLWQMDFLHRAATGQLSEVFGSKTLSIDIAMRTIGIQHTAQMIADSMDANTKSLMQSYSDGINYFLFTHVDNLPDEFVLRGYTPRYWEIKNSIAISRFVAWMLNMAWYVDLTYDEIIDSAGYRKAKEIFPDRPSGAPVIVPKWNFKNRSSYSPFDTNKSYSSLLKNNSKKTSSDFAQYLSVLNDAFGFHHLWSGSNNWVIHGSKTQSGKPLIANDPHLSVLNPSLWYELHLSGGELDVSGFGIPGLPFVVIGNNQRIAWAFTNSMMDEADIYSETIDQERYRFNGLWKPLKKRLESITVKDSANVELTVYSTHRGPIISKMVSNPLKENQALSLRWMGHDFSDEFKAFDLLNRAKTWDDFRQAASFYRLPGQNALYADVDGNIGYQCMAAVPLRRDGNYFSVLDGSSGQYDWRGYFEPDDLPYLFNPDKQYIATANNPIIAENQKVYFSSYWESDSRIRRIQQLIESKNQITVKDCQEFQLDVYSIHAMEMLPYLLKVCAADSLINAANPEPETINHYQEAYLLFKHWNGEMHTESQPTVVFNAFFNRLLYNTFHDEMGDTLFKAFVKLTNIPIRSVQAIIEFKKSGWWDNLTTVEIAETRDDIIRQSFIEAVDGLFQQSGHSPGAVFWKDYHTIELNHPFGTVFPFNYYFNKGRFPVAGNATTINKSEYDFSSANFMTTVIPTFRRIVDCRDIQTSRSVLSTGQSGQPMSPFYFDQFPYWSSGQLKTVSMNKQLIRSYEHHLIFKPK